MAIKCPTCHSDNPDTLKFCGECGTQLPPPQDHPPVMTETLHIPVRELATGTLFAGRYQVIEELGHGGMGRVYKVFDTKIKEKVALKLIKPEIAFDKDTIERFNNEIRLARRIRHKNVCGMFDIGEAEGAHFITMEYVHGEDLKSMIHMSGSLSVGMLLSVGKQVCDGLTEAHTLGVVHRDLKPQNIMIDKNGNAKIMDFGIARSVREKGITGPSVRIGTPEYMSPEQAEAKDVDHCSDIYSLGVILFEMATSHVPFEGETALSIAMKHRSETPKNPRGLNPNIPADLSGVILKCLDKDKDKRYQSASDVRSELEKIEKGLPTTERVVTERKPVTSRQITVQFSLKKLLVPSLAGIAVVAFALGIWQIAGRKKIIPIPAGKPTIAVLYFKNNTGDQNLDFWRVALSDSIITDLSQSRFINVLGADQLLSVLRKLGLLDASAYASEDVKRIAAEGRVNHVLQGTLSKAGDIFRIDYSLQGVGGGNSIGSSRVEGKGDTSLFAMVDELTKKVRQDLKLTNAQISADPDRGLREITTGSPEAYRFFVEGVRFNGQGDFAQSVESFKKAVTLDPEFAMAWRGMAAAFVNMGNYTEYIRYHKKALEFSDRISERERLLIQAQAEINPDKAIEICNKLIVLYPDDIRGHQTLGSFYSVLEEWDNAQKHFEWCYQAGGKENPIIVSNLAELSLAKGMYAEAKKILEEYLDTFLENAILRSDLAIVHLCLGELDRALVEADRAYSLSPTDRAITALKGDIFLCLGDLKKAELEYRKLLKPEDPLSSLSGWSRLWSLDLLQGKFKQGEKDLAQALELGQRLEPKFEELSIYNQLSYNNFAAGYIVESLEAADKAVKIADGLEPMPIYFSGFAQQQKLWPILMRGLIYVQSNSLEKASRTAEELNSLVLRRAEKRWHLYLVGLIELGKKNDAKALASLKEALSLEPHQWSPDASNTAFFMEALARAFFQSGDMENARKKYEEITRLTAGRVRYGDIYAKSSYMLGKISEQQGDKARARENYQRFLDLWKDADPGIPEVEDAGNRLAGLKGR